MTALDVRKLIQEMLVPEINEIKNRVMAIESKIEVLDSKFVAVNSRFDAVEFQLRTIERDISLSINIHERLAALEAKINR